MTDMAELFARDPSQHTRESIDEIIAYYRKAREQFILGDKGAGSTKRATKEAGPKAKIEKIDLADLLGKVQS